MNKSTLQRIAMIAAVSFATQWAVNRIQPLRDLQRTS